MRLGTRESPDTHNTGREQGKQLWADRMHYDNNRSLRRTHLPDTVKEGPKPVLVGRKKRNGASKDERITTDAAPQSPPNGSPSASIPAMPDHSRVPGPSKRLLGAKEMMEYWLSVPEPERSAWFIAYVYRKYPFCDVYQPFSKAELLIFQQNKGKKRIPYNGKILERPDSNCGSLSQPLDPETWEQQIYERWGAGDYQIRLNDQHESVHETVTECHIRNLRDWERYPPVLALNTVVLTAEDNQPYLRWARLKGIKFPGDPETPELPAVSEESEVQATTVEKLLEQNRDLTDKVVQMGEKGTAGPSKEDPTSRGQLGGVETVVEASKQGMKIMGDAMRQVSESQAKASDPNEHLKHVVEIAKLLQPPPAPPSNGNEAILMKMLEQSERNATRQLEQAEKNFSRILDQTKESHTATMEMMKGRMDSLEKQLTEAKTQTPTTREEASLDNFIRLKKKLKELDEDEPAASEDPPWLRLGEKLLDGAGDMLRNIVALRSMATPAPQQTVVEVEAPAPAIPPVQENPVLVKNQRIAQMVHPHLVAAMKQGVAGYEFAAAIINEAGQGMYDDISRGGYNGVMEIIKAHQPLLTELLTPPLSGVMLDKFLGEFLERDKAMQCAQMAKGNGSAPPSTPPSRKPVVS